MERKYYLRGLGIGIVVTAIVMGFSPSGKKSMTDAEIIARAKKLGMVENTVLSDLNHEDAGKEDEKPAGNDNEAGQDSQDKSQGASLEKQDGPGQTEATEPEESEQTAKGDETARVSGEEDMDTADAEEEDSDTGDAPDNLGKAEAAEPDSKAGGAQIETSGRTGGVTAAEAAGEQEDVKDIITSATVKTITVSNGDGSYTVARKLADAGVVTSAESFDTFLCQNGYDKKLRTGTFSIPADASDEQIARIVTGAE